MLIALITILFLGGDMTGMLDYISDSQDTVKAVMEKDDRRKEALSTLKAMEKRAKARNKVVNGASKDISRLLAQDRTDNAAVDAAWNSYFAERDAYNSDMLDLRFQLKDQITREEWRQIFTDE